MSQFQKGQPRHPNSGRKPGSKNKRKIPKVADFLAEKNINPVDEIYKLIISGDMKDAERISAWQDLLSYCQARPKDEEIGEGEDDDLLDAFGDISEATLLKLVKSPNEAV